MTPDLDAILPLDEIRRHTKTDDVPHVTDSQLELYRRAAFEAAELYTGMVLNGVRQIEENVDTDKRPNRHGMIKHRTRYAVADGQIYVQSPNGHQSITVARGARSVMIPAMTQAIDGCCNPCGENNVGVIIRYSAGAKCADDVPAGIIIGMLKYIAWCVANPGDEIMTVRNRLGSSEQGLTGTNDGALASGAIDEWRHYRDVR